MGKRLLNLNKNSKKLAIGGLLALILIGLFFFIKYGVKGSVNEPVTKVVYIDNEKRLITTESTDPVRALRDNGIEVFPEDAITTELILDPVSLGAVGERIVVKRAPVVHVFADGKNTDLRSWLKTIGEVFKDKGFPLGPKDIVDPKQEALVSNGAYVTVTRINELEEEKEAPIAYQTSYEKDYWLPKGQTKVKQAGVNGVKKQIFKVRLTNGVETSRVLISQSTVTKPVSEIIVKGVRPTNDKYNRWPQIVEVATKYGVDAEDMYNVMYCESKGYQYAINVQPNVTYSGIFQWDGSFYNWAAKVGFAGADIFDVTAQMHATAYRASKHGWSAWGACRPK